MKRVIYFLVLILISSCSFFDSKQKRTQELINEELRHIDWNSVDSYPFFYSCDEAVTKDQQKICFEETLISHFQETLNDFEFTLTDKESETVDVIFVIDTLGRIRVSNIEKNVLVLDQMPEFDGVVTQSLKNLPKLAPAIKRGIPVNTKYRIPIQLKTN
ncbi:MAG: hypothetical protein ABJF56_08375 [Maribacter dokdonensis]|uniref:TonB protein C-terminal n=2 Tax=Maribacter dokdonensis TaxID=320912 RepID=A0A1H4MKD5_9FLAO|nr:hypothetical protein [Maribacter dokdonensis]KSA15158.1 hypothetical protein I600_1769 [Maribacter dokdonensis DSW-8]MDP2525720.1 hypothetical protein [Maribacter dokdonensis]SEB83158.1 hypothetical protein SAMN05192540_1661 [Maribacter dokdonensis]|tara:strand:+ start:1022 stop:1498 length:477 start_codon:yes stop_codon:yes gene_type:complete